MAGSSVMSTRSLNSSIVIGAAGVARARAVKVIVASIDASATAAAAADARPAVDARLERFLPRASRAIEVSRVVSRERRRPDDARLWRRARALRASGRAAPARPNDARARSREVDGNHLPRRSSRSMRAREEEARARRARRGDGFKATRAVDRTSAPLVPVSSPPTHLGRVVRATRVCFVGAVR